MPFYEYQCKACGAQTEVLQKITDAPLKKCPECGKNQLTKLVSAPVFRLKGGGWYETDFKTDKDNKRNLVGSDKAESKPEEKSETKTEAKADTKADAKPEAKVESKPEPKSASKSAAKPVRAKAPAKAKSKAKRR
ncbi:MAG: FmdB family zinc ribbon protein [Pseudomonadota bacterium]